MITTRIRLSLFEKILLIKSRVWQSSNWGKFRQIQQYFILASLLDKIVVRLLKLPLKKECSAVRAKCSDKIAPPQNDLLRHLFNILVLFFLWSKTCQGHSSGSANSPPSILLIAVVLLLLIGRFFKNYPGFITQSKPALDTKEIEMKGKGTQIWRVNLSCYKISFCQLIYWNNKTAYSWN